MRKLLVGLLHQLDGVLHEFDELNPLQGKGVEFGVERVEKKCVFKLFAILLNDS